MFLWHMKTLYLYMFISFLHFLWTHWSLLQLIITSTLSILRIFFTHLSPNNHNLWDIASSVYTSMYICNTSEIIKQSYFEKFNFSFTFCSRANLVNIVVGTKTKDQTLHQNRKYQWVCMCRHVCVCVNFPTLHTTRISPRSSSLWFWSDPLWSLCMYVCVRCGCRGYPKWNHEAESVPLWVS